VAPNRTISASASDEIVLELFERLALSAGREVMRIFEAGCAVQHKADASPVTAADHAAEAIILSGLRAAFPDTVCVAEEEIAAGHLPAELGETFFLIDPLDGTREFVEQRKDFTVNIALIEQGIPRIGVVYAPARSVLFGGRPGRAEKAHTGSDHAVIDRRTITVREPGPIPAIVASRSHFSAETEKFIALYPTAELVSIGSSLKFCMLACGEADIYPRFSRTMEWDTAAGDAILRAAGGMTATMDGAPLTYGKRNIAGDSDFANPSFVARG
jgi:3'(2'), 5'-bisphosphate nucleotidase